MEEKIVDVIIPTYKRASFLSRAIDSVLSQSYGKVNVIVVDDNNEGDLFRIATEEIMEKYASNNRVTYLKHIKNKNGAAARNTGIKYSKADLIAFLDDDDFYMPERIEAQVKELESKDDTWGGCCCYHIRRYRQYAYKAYSVKENPSGNYCYDFLSGLTSTPSSTLLIRSSVFESVGLFDESFRRHQDLEFLVRFYRHYKMAVSPFYNVYMQVEGFRNYASSKTAFEIKTKFLEKYKGDIQAFTPDQISDILKAQWFEVAVLFLKDKDVKNAKILFRKYIFNHGNSSFGDYVKVMFFLITGFIPIVREFTSVFLGMTVYRKFSGNKLKKYKWQTL